MPETLKTAFNSPQVKQENEGIVHALPLQGKEVNLPICQDKI